MVQIYDRCSFSILYYLGKFRPFPSLIENSFNYLIFHTPSSPFFFFLIVIDSFCKFIFFEKLLGLLIQSLIHLVCRLLLATKWLDDRKITSKNCPFPPPS